MSIELAQLRDGHIALLSDENFPDKIGSVEYFRYDHQLQISYENEESGGWLLGKKLSDDAITALDSSPENVLIIHVKGQDTEEYYVPLHRIVP